jgi:hypothetical protein
MLRMCLLTSALCTALVIPPSASDETVIQARPQRAEVMAAASGMPVEAWTCAADSVAQEPDDESTRWRWRAYRHIDCLTTFVDHVMKTRVNGEEGTVTLSREELEHLRTRALWAKDATARIAR